MAPRNKQSQSIDSQGSRARSQGLEDDLTSPIHMVTPRISSSPLIDHAVGQIGIVTPDLERGVEEWSRIFGIGPWNVYRYGPENLPVLTQEGKEGRFSMRLALSGVVPQVELIEPLDETSIYSEWLHQHGAGIHHVGIFVESIAALAPGLIRCGFTEMIAGSGYGLDGDGAFAYFDTRRSLGVITELIEVPARRRQADLIIPGASAPDPGAPS